MEWNRIFSQKKCENDFSQWNHFPTAQSRKVFSKDNWQMFTQRFKRIVHNSVVFPQCSCALITKMFSDSGPTASFYFTCQLVTTADHPISTTVPLDTDLTSDALSNTILTFSVQVQYDLLSVAGFGHLLGIKSGMWAWQASHQCPSRSNGCLCL